MRFGVFGLPWRRSLSGVVGIGLKLWPVGVTEKRRLGNCDCSGFECNNVNGVWLMVIVENVFKVYWSCHFARDVRGERRYLFVDVKEESVAFPATEFLDRYRRDAVQVHCHGSAGA